MKNNIKYLFFIVIFAILGFSREYLFVNINNRLYKLYYHNSTSQLPDGLGFLSNFNYETLYYYKYPFTIIYYTAYLVVGYFAVKVLCNSKKNAMWLLYIYAFLLVLSGISMTYNYFVNNQLGGDEYTFSRWLMGIAQSPLVAFFMIASGKLYNKFQNEQ